MPEHTNKPHKDSSALTDDVLRKTTTLSTRVNENGVLQGNSIFFPQTRSPPTNEADSGCSPIKWGFLGAAVSHLANAFISGVSSRAPWSCLHYTINISIVFLLFYVVIRWSGRFDTNLYVRRCLLRLSWGISALMLGCFFGQLGVVIALHKAPLTRRNRFATTIGEVVPLAVWQPSLSALFVMLWSIFAGLQHLAVENIRAAQSSISQQFRNRQEVNVTIAEEIALQQRLRTLSSNVVVTETSSIRRFAAESLAYYGPMLSAVAYFWTVGFILTAGAPHIALAGYFATATTLLSMIFLGWRSQMHSITLQICCILYSVLATGLNFLSNTFSAVRRVRWGLSISLLSVQILILVVSVYWLRDHGLKAKEESSKANSLFQRRRHQDDDEDPMKYFMAGVAKKEEA